VEPRRKKVYAKFGLIKICVPEMVCAKK